MLRRFVPFAFGMFGLLAHCASSGSGGDHDSGGGGSDGAQQDSGGATDAGDAGSTDASGPRDAGGDAASDPFPAIAACPGGASRPELPRVFLDTTYVPGAGRTIMVNAGDDLQAAINSAVPGDTLMLQPGATFNGNFTLPEKTGTGWVVIRSAAPDAMLPPPGTRVSPAFASAMPRLTASNTAPVIATAPRAHHYRLIGLEVTGAPSLASTYNLVWLGEVNPPATGDSLDQVPHDIVLDRVYVHGNPQLDLRRCVALNSARTAVIDSYLSECHSTGFDAQAVYGWNGPGPFKIVNNYLEGSGENVGFGGPTPSIQGLIPSDIEIRGNHIVKPMSWHVGDPSFVAAPNGGHWRVKNLFELKSGQRILLAENVLENNWQDGQNGFALLTQSLTDDNTAPWNNVSDIAIVHNVVRHSPSGYNLSGRVAYASSTSPAVLPTDPSARICVAQNLFEHIGDDASLGGDGRLFQVLADPHQISYVHNTGDSRAAAMLFDAQTVTDLIVRDNVIDLGTYGVFGNGTGAGTPTLNRYAPGYVFDHNVLYGTATASAYPAGNFFAADANAVGFVDPANGDYGLSSASPYRGMASDGRDPGVDMVALRAATQGATGP